MGVTQAIYDRIEDLRQSLEFFKADREAESELWRKTLIRRRIEEIDSEIDRLRALLVPPYGVKK